MLIRRPAPFVLSALGPRGDSPPLTCVLQLKLGPPPPGQGPSVVAVAGQEWPVTQRLHEVQPKQPPGGVEGKWEWVGSGVVGR